ncbi:hypothetical protein E4T56_gene16232 [Termitomyces sp. T112]|nr:hypothetical protein E4T56_gene16232 [Termitomyces sp. T112]
MCGPSDGFGAVRQIPTTTAGGPLAHSVAGSEPRVRSLESSVWAWGRVSREALTGAWEWEAMSWPSASSWDNTSARTVSIAEYSWV